MIKKFVAVLFISLCSCAIFAQEFNCVVKINSDQVEGTYKQMFTTLEAELNDFINTRKWTDSKFSNVEKIDCNLNFVIKSVSSQDNYVAELTIQARRPVYNSSYTTNTFNFRDTDVAFEYIEKTPIVYNEHTIESNLVAIISYYMYMILGVDFDSFSYMGGTSYFRQAENIVTLCQTIGATGWKAFDIYINRHALVPGMLEERMVPYRQMWYDYHRKGLDAMAQGAEKGKSVITNSLSTLKDIQSINSQSVLLTLFLDSKIDELINVYSLSSQTEKEDIYKMLTNIYPSYSRRLEDIRKIKK